MKRRALYVLIVVSLVGSTAAPVWTRSDNEGVAGLPADVTPMLTLAGIWQGVTDEHVTPVNHGGISNFYSAQPPTAQRPRRHCDRQLVIRRVREHDATLVPVSIALFEQQSDDTLQLATSRYVPDPLTNGVSSVVVADFNRDGVDDFVMPAWNEAPNIPADSVATGGAAGGVDPLELGGESAVALRSRETDRSARHPAVHPAVPRQDLHPVD